MTPDVAAWLVAAGRRLAAWHERSVSELLAGRPAPPWAASLVGEPPDVFHRTGAGPASRESAGRLSEERPSPPTPAAVAWATAVAEALLYRRVMGLEAEGEERDRREETTAGAPPPGARHPTRTSGDPLGPEPPIEHLATLARAHVMAAVARARRTSALGPARGRGAGIPSGPDRGPAARRSVPEL